MTHYEEDITIGSTTNYATGGYTVLVTKGVQLLLVDHVTQKAQSSAPGVGNSSQVSVLAAVQGSESGQAFRLRAYTAITAGLTEIAANATSSLLNGNPIHVSYEGT